MKKNDFSDFISWDSPWRDLKILVAGIGLSGFAVADTLLELGAEVTVIDSVDNNYNRARADTLKILGATVLLGSAAVESIPRFGKNLPDIVVSSPGWHKDSSILVEALSLDIPIWSEVELAWRVQHKASTSVPSWLVVTGTNGKTSTVKMLESILVSAGVRVATVGNIGVPILDAIRDPEVYDIYIVELSSFQLHWTYSVHPWASVCLNIASDHIDWHGSFEDYRLDKARIYANTTGFCIYNVAYTETRDMVLEADVVTGARAVGFTLGIPEISTVGVVDGIVCDRAFIENRSTAAVEILSVSDVVDRLGKSAHVLENFLAAAALARSVDVEPKYIKLGLDNFVLEDHRNEYVVKKFDIEWVNDSKATNLHAAKASLLQHDSIIWILGGFSKNIDYSDLFLDISDRIRAAIVIGIDRRVFLESLKQFMPGVPVYEVDEISGREAVDHAVKLAYSLARSKDCVLFAPAASSKDQFASYAERGNLYKESVFKIIMDDI